VRRGQVLFTLYSPELYLAELDYLAAIASQRAARQTSAPDRADYLVAAAAQRLRLADVDEGEINRLNESGLAAREIPIRSPQGGVVIEKDIVAGAAVQPGMKLLRIAGMERVWVEAAVYQADLPRVGLGQRATVRLPAQPELQLVGRVALVAPLLEPASRTAQVRIELANPFAHGAPVLLPNMSVEVDLATAGAAALVVPEGAVLSTGTRTLVFVDEGGGRYRQREVRLGPRLGDGYTVLAGLAADDRVVTAGQFLLDAEVRIRGAGAGPGG
jgi:Cu(I)/Ag(I) efflux system membrane fusion protein